MFQDLKDFVDGLKKIWIKSEAEKEPCPFLPIPKKINDFSGLEILTRVNGRIVSRCLHSATDTGVAQHHLLEPRRLDDTVMITGYSLKIHKDLY